jgi:hypothetical protein
MHRIWANVILLVFLFLFSFSYSAARIRVDGASINYLVVRNHLNTSIDDDDDHIRIWNYIYSPYQMRFRFGYNRWNRVLSPSIHRNAFISYRDAAANQFLTLVVVFVFWSFSFMQMTISIQSINSLWKTSF